MNKTVVVLLWGLAAACGGGGDSTPDAPSRACQDMGGSACFKLPTAPLSNRDGQPSALGCGPIVPALAPSALSISGVMSAYGTNKPVGGGSVKLYSSPDYATPFATTTAAADGTYSIDVPQGTPDVLFGEYTSDGYLVVYPQAQRANLTQGNITDFRLSVLTPDAVESAALLAKEIWDPAYMVIAGNVYDCQRLVVMHAVVVLSTTSGTRSFATRASIYYSVPGAVPLVAPPDERWDTNDNAAYAAFHVPVDRPTLYLQAWGFVDAAAQAQGEAGLTLIGEQPVHIAVGGFGNVVIWTR
jgi:hypothetical protein